MTPKTININKTSPLTIQRISEIGFMERILRRKWEVIHGPTGFGIAPFRLHGTAKAAAKWLAENIPAEVLEGTNVESIRLVGEEAGWREEYKRLVASEKNQ